MIKRKIAGKERPRPAKRLNASDKPPDDFLWTIKRRQHEFFAMVCLLTLAFLSFANMNVAAQSLTSGIDREHDIHVVISSGCSVQQYWQSETLMWSWKNLKHPGKITRIVSGCKNYEAEVLFTQTSVQEANFFFTKDFTKMVGGKPCWFFNKPNGMQEFIKESGVEESVIVLLDPDMTLVKPFDNHLPTSNLPVTEGHPVMASYGLDHTIFDWHICSGNDCDVEMSQDEHLALYMGGPPYIMHRNDWMRMVDNWVDLSEKAFAKGAGGGASTTFVHTNAEMYGFILSCAQLGLRFNIDSGIMVSNPTIGSAREQWDFDKVVVMHYAHHYGKDHTSSEKWMRWSKHNHPHDLLINCDSWDYFDEEMYIDQFQLKPKHLFALQHSLVKVNKAARAWREKFGCGQLELFCPYNDACKKR